MVEKRERQKTIRDLLTRNEIESQEQLQALLLAEGLETTQSTLSRDLREMGIVKDARAYRLPSGETSRAALVRALRRAIRGSIRELELAGHLVVAHVVGGEARRLKAELRPLLGRRAAGLLADDDTLVVVTRSQAQARELVATLKRSLVRL